ncbi:MAG: hypothetical protein WAU86_20320 [Oricola sp.]
MSTAIRRLHTMLAALFAPSPGATGLPEAAKQELAVKAMLIGRSCCG